MCGRFALDASACQIKAYFELSKGFVMRSRYNIAPGNKVPVIRARKAHDIQIDFLEWGLRPAWAKGLSDAISTPSTPSTSPTSSLSTRVPNYINVRSETLFVKPTFKKIALHQRCIIPATGYYEWKSLANKKQPYYVSLIDYPLFGFAGIWDTWEDNQGHQQERCAILTREANDTLIGVHERMPLILSIEQHALWLSDTTSGTLIELNNAPLLTQHQL